MAHFGQTANETLLAQKKMQYPKYYTANDFTSQFGKKVHDCVGLIKGYLWTENGKITYVPSQDRDVTGMFNNCSETGLINTLPEMLGVLVFMSGHVGIYIGNGQVIEARGHAYGVVKTKLEDRNWTKWGKLKWIDYVTDKNVGNLEENMAFIKKKCGYDDNTMFWLSRYKYSDELFDKWIASYKK